MWPFLGPAAQIRAFSKPYRAAWDGQHAECRGIPVVRGPRCGLYTRAQLLSCVTAVIRADVGRNASLAVSPL